MQHTFDVEIACEYGIYPAIIFKDLNYWISSNEKNNKHFYDNNYWTYETIKSLHDRFPYMTEKVIRSALKLLEEKELIISGNYNKFKVDRTKWYAITEKGKSIILKGQMQTAEKANEKCPKGQMQLSEKANEKCPKGQMRDVPEGKPIPNNDTTINNNSNNVPDDDIPQGSLKEAELARDFELIWNRYPRKQGKNKAFNHYKAWIKGRKYAGRNVKLTNRQMWFAVNRYANMTVDCKMEAQFIQMGSTFFNDSIMEYVDFDE